MFFLTNISLLYFLSHAIHKNYKLSQNNEKKNLYILLLVTLFMGMKNMSFEKSSCNVVSLLMNGQKKGYVSIFWKKVDGSLFYSLTSTLQMSTITLKKLATIASCQKFGFINVIFRHSCLYIFTWRSLVLRCFDLTLLLRALCTWRCLFCKHITQFFFKTSVCGSSCRGSLFVC